jgi:hypothetical protein
MVVNSLNVIEHLKYSEALGTYIRAHARSLMMAQLDQSIKIHSEKLELAVKPQEEGKHSAVLL